jgi:protein-S-isoprenylcysteine O-methyltransferase Ste14
MSILPGSHVVVEKVPEVGTVRGFLRAAVTLLGLAVVALLVLLWLEGQWPFAALLAQLAMYFVMRWLVAGFYRGRQDRLPYADALFNRFMPSAGLNLASILYVLLTAGAFQAAAQETGPFVPFIVGLVGAVYLLASGALLTWRALQSAGLDTILGVYVYYPNEGRKVEGSAYAVVRHPLYAALDRVALAFALWNGSVYALLLAALFIAVWHPIWYGIEERELLDRFGEAYDTYAKSTPAVIPQGLAGERALWQSLFRR